MQVASVLFRECLKALSLTDRDHLSPRLIRSTPRGEVSPGLLLGPRGSHSTVAFPRPRV